jgi:type I restriction enzyme S subunit
LNELKKYKFSELYEMSSGISSKPEQAGHGAPFCSFTTVFNNYLLPPELPDRMDTSIDEQETYSLKEGDVLLTRTSETLDELGMSSVAVKDYPGATFSGFLKRLRPTQTNVVYHKYLAFYLRSPLFRKAMNNNAVMTLRCSLNEQIFSYLKLLLPDFNQQKKIGDLLFQIYSKIELNNRINAELEGLAKLLYDYWFVQFDFPISAAQATAMGKPELEGKPYRSSGGKMVYSEMLKREIPQGWADGSLERLGKIVGGSTPSTEIGENFCSNGTPWITPKDLSVNMGNRFIDRGAVDVTSQGIKSASLKIHPAGTVLMSSRAPIGYLAIARNPVTTNQGFKSIVPGDGFSSDYIFFTLQHFMNLIKANASGSTFKEISGGTLKAVKIHLPPADLVTEFTKAVSSFSNQQSLLEQQNQELTQLRDWLLPMLMNGQVTVGS